MKILFSKAGKHCYLADKERLIFCIDGVFYNENGDGVAAQEAFIHTKSNDDHWYQYWMDDEGLLEPLKSESTIKPVCEIDDIFGNFGFKNQAGDFVIEPQYAYAYEFTNGLAAVNLNRTWYKTPDGHRCYENHYGYIDGNGKTVISFQFEEAYPFNKYGVALVATLETGWFLIDLQGNEIPGTRFPYIGQYYYDDRFIEFSSGDDDNALVGLYDTKERKVLFAPMFEAILEENKDTFHVWKSDGEYDCSDSHTFYINRKGEIITPWLYGKGFAIIDRPDVNNITAVATSHFTEQTGQPQSCFEHNGKKYERKFVYGLYSSKEEFLLPQEYNNIRKCSDDIWVCCKDNILTIVKTEPGD